MTAEDSLCLIPVLKENQETYKGYMMEYARQLHTQVGSVKRKLIILEERFDHTFSPIFIYFKYYLLGTARWRSDTRENYIWKMYVWDFLSFYDHPHSFTPPQVSSPPFSIVLFSHPPFPRVSHLFVVLRLLSQSPAVTFLLRCDPCFQNQILFMCMLHLLFIALNFHSCLVSTLYEALRRVQVGFEPSNGAVNFLKDVFTEVCIFATRREETKTETDGTLMS